MLLIPTLRQQQFRQRGRGTDRQENAGGAPEPTLNDMRWFVKPLDGDFGKRPITEITPQELLHELRKHERRGRLETANLLRAFAGRVLRYGWRQRGPSVTRPNC